MAGTVQDLVDGLAERYPEDEEDLRLALEVLRQQRVGSCERLARLTDAQWQRLGLPVGIEALLRDEAADAVRAAGLATGALPAVAGGAADQAVARVPPSPPQRPQPLTDGIGGHPLEPCEPEGLYQRGAGGARSLATRRQASPPPSVLPDSPPSPSSGSVGAGFLDLQPPSDLGQLWRQLLEDTLPPDKRGTLQETWESLGSDQDRYLMFLEYSSYLRKPEVSPEEQAARRKQLDPLLRELGIRPGEEEPPAEAGCIWWVAMMMLVFVLGLVYYGILQPEPGQGHDTESL